MDWTKMLPNANLVARKIPESCVFSTLLIVTDLTMDPTRVPACVQSENGSRKNLAATATENKIRQKTANCNIVWW